MLLLYFNLLIAYVQKQLENVYSTLQWNKGLIRKDTCLVHVTQTQEAEIYRQTDTEVQKIPFYHLR